jgi:opacity protein-like surface antigen
MERCFVVVVVAAAVAVAVVVAAAAAVVAAAVAVVAAADLEVTLSSGGWVHHLDRCSLEQDWEHLKRCLVDKEKKK